MLRLKSPVNSRVDAFLLFLLPVVFSQAAASFYEHNGFTESLKIPDSAFGSYPPFPSSSQTHPPTSVLRTCFFGSCFVLFFLFEQKSLILIEVSDISFPFSAPSVSYLEVLR